jgi:hypothetical protein
MKNEPAFPQENSLYKGLTMRDYFASKIVVAFLDKQIGELDDDVMHTYAYVAYMMADRMMEARK